MEEQKAKERAKEIEKKEKAWMSEAVVINHE